MIEQYINPETISSIIALFLAVGGASLWAKGKSMLSELRDLIVKADDALKDNKVTKEEFDGIVASIRKLTTL